MNINDILRKYRTQAFSERDKGTRFERLMQAYLQAEPKYQAVLEKVWLWGEFPYRKDFGSGKDVGIDLVARTFDGKFWAVQCKCYDEHTAITKADVDTFLATSEKRFQNEELQGVGFSQRLWISTTNNWSSEAELSLHNHAIPVNRINLTDLDNAPVDWSKLEEGVHGAAAVLKERELRKHQQKAVTLFHEHFLVADRGRLIMACGTGKTFTSLRIAEDVTAGHGHILFLVPSIALLGQTLNEWATFAKQPIKPICICSDAEVAKKKTENDIGGYTIEDLALPASTNVENIVEQFHAAAKNPNQGMTVVFSTYQSIERVSAAQKALNQEQAGSGVFDLIICDEAHRTTGVSLKNDEPAKKAKGEYDESAFVRVHDNDFLQGRKRIYMTATPRLYKDEVKEKAKEAEAYLCSMDDPAIYGEEVYRIGFGEAVENDLLSDYKVLVLTVQTSEVPKEFQEAIANSQGEISADDVSKLIGCINALSKRTIRDEELIKSSDPSLMHTAVAFCQSIKVSKHITSIFNAHKHTYYESLSPEVRGAVVTVEAKHIDGTMGATTRQDGLTWLKGVPVTGNDCRILTNVRCLSEGVDVPCLDSVMFLSSRNSQVDVVQAVGRVMRKSPGKKYGYIIIPVIIPEDLSPEEALDKSDCFGVVWTVLNALRAHDDRFNAEINKIELNRKPIASPTHTTHIGCKSNVGNGDDEDGGNGNGGRSKDDSHIHVVGVPDAIQQELALKFETLQSVIFARMVKKVGTRRYWELWAKDVAAVAEKHIERITALVAKEGPHQTAFAQFLAGLHRNLNPSIPASEAIEMLAQHIITKPVFEALFENYSFVANNPVSIAMQKMIDLLDEETPAKEAEVMAKFYKSIAERCEGIDNAEGRQKVIVELYDKFFKSAFPKTVEKLGIVYTPVEVVDFIIQSVADVLQAEFGRDLSDENVHVLDPFTGTGTFIARLLQSGHIRPEALQRKYLHELHANEIVLLAYYIASINIENIYHDLTGESKQYHSFDGICLTDTFQLGESDDSDKLFSEMFEKNSERVIAQKKAPIRIIIGNPPYSVGQKSANDNAQNQSYERLEKRVADSYAKGSQSTNKNSLYDSYIKAFRWASDRLDPKNGGIIAFVSNGAWIDGNATSGFRKCLKDEFTSVYVFNLRGNCRTSGEQRRRECGNVFGLGSRTPISITLLVKNPSAPQGNAKISYHDIGDYLTREDKLAKLKELRSILNPAVGLSSITPNEAHDWINQRDGLFETYIALEPDKKFNQQSRTVFTLNSMGVGSSRDTWVYNSSAVSLASNMQLTIDFYNEQVKKYINRDDKKLEIEKVVSFDPTKISWSSSLLPNAQHGNYTSFNADSICTAIYRPFFKQRLYYGDKMIHRRGQWDECFPTPQTENLVICVSGIAGKTFSALMTNTIPDLHILESGTQCFPLYYYEKVEHNQLGLFDRNEGDYIRRDGISDFILKQAREQYGSKVTKDDVFYYVYGLLHSRDYRQRFSADLSKMLPRIPMVETSKHFHAITAIGRKLAELHVNYESVPKWDTASVSCWEGKLVVEKMRFAKNGKADDKTCILLNKNVQVSDIPQEAYKYVVNGKSAIEWLMERYQYVVNPESKLVNDPNAWGKEHGNPDYILDLILRIITVSMKTQQLVDELPHLDF